MYKNLESSIGKMSLSSSFSTNNSGAISRTSSRKSSLSSTNSDSVNGFSPSNLNRFQVLCFEQVCRLHNVMESEMPLHGRGNFPTLNLCLKDLICVVQTRLEEEGIEVRDVRLNGGVASYIIGKEDMHYNDLDLLFGVDLSNGVTFRKIKTVVLESLLNFFPENMRHMQLTECNLKEGYVQKMARIHNYQSSDCWSLISLGSPCGGQTVELKFVDKMRRQFEFTVDSFQIVLDSLLTFYGFASQPITEHFYPTVVAESVSGSFQEALYHLNNKLISTHHPEEIRGGGLLKYCKLLVENYHWTKNTDVYLLERYMCSRFFIDFPDLPTQRAKLQAYLLNHVCEDDVKVAYLRILYNVVRNSTICLMNHERHQTLQLIESLIYEIQVIIEARQNVILLEPFNCDNWVLDQVFYGTEFFPKCTSNCFTYFPPTPDTSPSIDLSPSCTLPTAFQQDWSPELMLTPSSDVSIDSLTFSSSAST